MKHINYLDEPPEKITETGAHGAEIRWVLGEKDGVPNFYMRVISFEPGGASPHHSHPWEHETFILSGQGTLEVDEKTVKLAPGDVAYVPPNAVHCFRATESMEMLCLIPRV
ncbi:MAG: cupin domain-containing protein [Desulfosalsimonas sp.]